MAATGAQTFFGRIRPADLLGHSDIVASLGLISILMLMIIPLPPILLDLCLAANITIAILILIISLYTQRAMEFSIFPSLLLATTLFRLSLNVASTRLILLHGNEGMDAAGSVIQAFGQFVVGGSYVVGMVIFVILVLINFIVITKGAGRIAEVAARFTLDAMPGKQMAIDADLNAGLIDEQTARKRREEISGEASFHGAMDGASKFVRGDAIAGIIITFINIGAGFVIGVLQKGMPMADAAKVYTILTVGDGLVGQVPALIISTAAGMLVTRTSGRNDFGTELKAQFSRYAKALWVVAGILLGFALIPGMPFVPFVCLSAALAFAARRLDRAERARVVEAGEVERPQPVVRPDQDYEKMLNVELVELEVGYGLIPFVDAAQDGELLARIQSIRKQFALTSGFIVPPVHIKDNLQLNPNQYTISLKGAVVASAEMMPGSYMAMDPGLVTETVKGLPTREPAFDLPALWITEDKRERAQIAVQVAAGGRRFAGAYRCARVRLGSGRPGNGLLHRQVRPTVAVVRFAPVPAGRGRPLAGRASITGKPVRLARPASVDGRGDLEHGLAEHAQPTGAHRARAENEGVRPQGLLDHFQAGGHVFGFKHPNLHRWSPFPLIGCAPAR